MQEPLPNLQALALLVAVIDEGSLGAAARKLDMQQPNASRMIAQLEAEVGASLLDRHPRGSRPTAAGLVLAAHARTLLDAAGRFTDWLRHQSDGGSTELRLGASMTIAEFLLPAWLTELRRREPRTRVDLQVLNSTQVLEEVRDGRLQLGFIETPNIPGWVNGQLIAEDELVVVAAPGHPWADRPAPIGRDELAATPLVVREGGSGTREAFEGLVGDAVLAPPAQTLGSNAAVRIAVAAGAAPAVLSTLAIAPQLRSGELLRIPVRGAPLRRPFTAVWSGPKRLHGPAAALVAVARHAQRTPTS